MSSDAETKAEQALAGLSDDDDADENSDGFDVESFKAEVEQAVTDAIESGNGTAQTTRTDLFDTAEQVARENDFSKFDFMEFQAALVERGVDQDDASQAWDHLRENTNLIAEDGTHPRSKGDNTDTAASTMPTPTDTTTDVNTDDAQENDADDIIVLLEGHEGSELVANALAEPLMNEDIRIVPVTSEEGKAIVAAMPDDVSVPFHAVDTPFGFEQGNLRDLLAEHLTL